ncbi:MAG: hypothetical protein E7564_05925 [Ruminococcaceae bacterium]|nr:hypothetical protein [Oscillospiraceae bacterium]
MLNDFEKVLKEAKMPPKKKLIKNGTVKINVVETTPVVWEGRLLRFEWLRNFGWGGSGQKATNANMREKGCYHFVDHLTEKEVGAEFAFDHAFGCCYNDEGTMYAHGTRGGGGGNYLDTFYSKDLVNWESKEAICFPEDIMLFNTSVCKDDEGYVMAIEIGGKNEAVGVPFTIVFAKSKNLVDWELLDMMEYSYTRDRYSACPVIRYYGGQYYMIYLEGAPCHRWIPYIVRSKDLINWELGVTNPIMYPSDEDKILVNHENFTDFEKEYINNAVDCNNSDIDLCEFEGRTYIVYSWGNQFGKEFLATAEYDGSEEEFLKSFFAD